MQPDALLTGLWYFALPASTLKRGKTVAKEILGEPVLFVRSNDGTVSAMRDICPHQGIPLRFGKFDGTTVSCGFHGWEFDTEGVCTKIPSLTSTQSVNLKKICTQSYPCVEKQGNIWIFMGEQTKASPKEPPTFPGLEEGNYWTTCTTLKLESHIDYANIALMDPAHVPFVHSSWWFRNPSTMKEKTKLFVPSEMGFTMAAHSASTPSPIYKLMGGIPETEIRFVLPGIRIEHLSFGGKTFMVGVTTLTPMEAGRTEINHKIYWTNPVMKLMKPIVQHISDDFLGQDQDIAYKQQQGLKYKPNLMMTIKDAGTPVKWYYQLKDNWIKSVEKKESFENPLQKETLSWVT